MGYKAGKELKVNFQGNGIKSMHISLEASLKKLRTSYVDIVSDDAPNIRPQSSWGKVCGKNAVSSDSN